MKLTALFALSFLLIATGVHSQVAGVVVQVNEAKRMPTVAQLEAVLRPGDFVRDVLGWNRVDHACNLRNNPSTPIILPPSMGTLYQLVAAAQAKNFVTLGFNNKFCGQAANSGAVTFPNTPELRAEFAAYAVRIVKQVPALGGISIWNEMNGTWSGGYTNRAQKLAAYCQLANKVITEVRKVNATIPITIGATVGWNIDTWFIDMFQTYGCIGKGDPTIWLDGHPYFTGRRYPLVRKTDWQLWNDSVANIRANGISNPLMLSEWGGPAAYHWVTAHPNGNYMNAFKLQVLSKDPMIAGSTWFEMLYDRNAPNAGLFDATGSLTTFGTQYKSLLK